MMSSRMPWLASARLRGSCRSALAQGLLPALALGGLLLATGALGADAGDPFGRAVDYRSMPGLDGKWLNPRNLVWVFAQLHLLFAAFLLAVPMFVLIIEVVGILQKDPKEARRYDDLAHEFTRLLTTAASATAILGAGLTFGLFVMYPKLMSYLVDVFGNSMYLYSVLFFGEYFSLYLYYAGWGKMSRRAHVAVGVALNAFGVVLMLIANAWTTFMMAPIGQGHVAALAADGSVIDRSAAFWNFLLHPINIHRLIANLCLGGSVAAAYAAYKFLSTKDPEKRAHYDWMGYIGNFIAVLFLLPLPFAGYFLGYEIYAFNQQLGITMMGGVLSWLFIMQAVLIGVLFLAANYYLWLGMDRIEGAERYRGWIKFLLAIVTIGVIVWATPRSLNPTAPEAEAMGGTSHPIVSYFGVMSAKNTAVNLIILTTFLSFILYRRGNKVPTVSWAPLGKIVQVAAFAITAAVVVVIGIGGYMPSLWLESTKRIAMSPWQVVAVLACMAVVMPVDILMFRNAKEIGRIRWGQVSVRSQYVLILLAVTFTWTMGLMGFVRSALRQHWHVYEVMQDKSEWAYTPALGYATIMVTVCVMLFFLLVGFVAWIAELGAHHAEDEALVEAPRKRGMPAPAWGVVVLVLIIAVVAILRGLGGGGETTEAARSMDLTWIEQASLDRATSKAQLAEYARVDPATGVYQVPIARAMDLVLADPSLLAGVPMMILPVEGMTPVARGEMIFNKLQPCATCHSTDGTPKIGPSMKGLWGRIGKLQGGAPVTADEAYIRESIAQPLARIVDGFAPVMPAVPVTDEDMTALLAYIESLK